MRSGVRFSLRHDQSENNDYGIAYEIFVHDLYAPPVAFPPHSVKLIVDLGTNVGLATLYFLNRFPDAHAIGLEPHPGHFRQAMQNIESNGFSNRISLHNKAAGAKSRAMHLSDKGTSSSLLDGDAEQGLQIDVIDLFSVLDGRRIDILKMDIEGGEYEIMADPRFKDLNIGAVVMEWHTRGGGDADRIWCEDRLREAGFRISPIFTEPNYGMFWALR
jgi:FkbM family methyltransferase